MSEAYDRSPARNHLNEVKKNNSSYSLKSIMRHVRRIIENSSLDEL